MHWAVLVITPHNQPNLSLSQPLLQFLEQQVVLLSLEELSQEPKQEGNSRQSPGSGGDFSASVCLALSPAHRGADHGDRRYSLRRDQSHPPMQDWLAEGGQECEAAFTLRFSTALRPLHRINQPAGLPRSDITSRLVYPTPNFSSPMEAFAPESPGAPAGTIPEAMGCNSSTRDQNAHHLHRNAGRRGYLPVAGQALQVELDGGSDAHQHDLVGGGSRHTSRQVGHIGRKPHARWFDHHGIGDLHRRRTPDCFSMLCRVLGPAHHWAYPPPSSLPGRIGCLHWWHGWRT
jgi:hypothetical protein